MRYEQRIEISRGEAEYYQKILDEDVDVEGTGQLSGALATYSVTFGNNYRAEISVQAGMPPYIGAHLLKSGIPHVSLDGDGNKLLRTYEFETANDNIYVVQLVAKETQQAWVPITPSSGKLVAKETQQAWVPITPIQMVSLERLHQLDKGYDAPHDDGHEHGELVEAAQFMLMRTQRSVPGTGAAGWPWEFDTPRDQGPIHDLVVAAAFCVAEIERLSRVQDRWLAELVDTGPSRVTRALLVSQALESMRALGLPVATIEAVDRVIYGLKYGKVKEHSYEKHGNT